VRASVRDSVGASVWASVWDSVRDSVGASVRDSVGASVRDSVWASVGWTNLSGDAEFGSWYEYWKEIEIVNDDKANKYIGFMRAGSFYTFFFEKVAFIMQRPDAVYQDEQKRLHSIEGPAIQWADGTGIYSINGVSFDKKLWEKVVGDKLTAQQVFAIENTEQRRVAYELMDKLKMKKLKNYEVLDHRDSDEQGKMDEIVQFNVDGFDEPFLYYHCECPTTGRRYFIQTEEKTCSKAKAKSFGVDEVNWIAEY